MMMTAILETSNLLDLFYLFVLFTKEQLELLSARPTIIKKKNPRHSDVNVSVLMTFGAAALQCNKGQINVTQKHTNVVE